MAENPLNLLFLNCFPFENGASIRGVGLVTDPQTKPLEFRCTEPVRPTSIQKVLYGTTLNQHIYAEVVAKPLLKALNHKPDIIIVRELTFVEKDLGVEQPIVWIGKHGTESFKTHDDDNRLITSTSGGFEPLIVRGPEGREVHTQKARSELQAIFASCDLLEPFERMKTAIELVHKNQAGNGRD